ncbi:malto-oligosyltrehalose trehalohydrolase [Izhakiella capsodis]|uniref:Malto-oligosyltrehalose trehalohydrolase n=1 Tax=Izhakiella capsodis TaxID=1367852 RepID=A0A1I4UV16_9GAMM|nr:malto-oligosyltrehalose trehalohydrolase [Izhakiella capsodis]SFM92812.1 malto-oligosyltrehalose trehalohydrolase [Izhakiella capsodis]
MKPGSFTGSWGAEIMPGEETRFRLWAPDQQRLAIRLNGVDKNMSHVGDGWFELRLSGVTEGAEYSVVLADGTQLPDPASRAQKSDVNGPSLLCNPWRYPWKNRQWRGRSWEESVIYELHMGTFTPEGTFHAATQKLAYLADLGFTVVEVMPLSQFGGTRGWGYDGVLMYAPHSAYGTPDDFRAFVDTAHGLGISVLLDIVLNHFGPEGNSLPQLASGFFDKQRMTPWGAGIDYAAKAPRQFIIEAPLYWLQAYRLDGLRFDAIDQIEDSAGQHILVEIAERIRQEITDRPVHLTSEDSRNITALHPYDNQGKPLLFTAEWNDDFHNAAHVLATGETHAYYADFATAPAKLFARLLAEGFAFQGEVAPQSGQPRGVKSGAQPTVAFIDFLQNHDQTGNRALGERLLPLAGADSVTVLLATLLLSPHIPLLFMGEEYGETNPFLFFTDFHGDLARAVREGRAREFADHAGHQDAEVPDPNAMDTFERSKLDWHKLETSDGKRWLTLVKTLLALRQQYIVPLLRQPQGNTGRVVDLSGRLIVVAWHLPNGSLSMAINLDDKSHPRPILPGRTLYSWPPSTEELPRNAILVRLDSGENQ